MKITSIVHLVIAFTLSFSLIGQSDDQRHADQRLKEKESKTITKRSPGERQGVQTLKPGPGASRKDGSAKQLSSERAPKPAGSSTSDDRIKHSKDDPQARLDFEILKTMDPKTGKVPDDIRLRELKFMRSQKRGRGISYAPGDVLTNWSNRGPHNVGGRTRALAVDVLTENTILAGGVSGGIWKSTDQGTSWNKTTGSNELQSVTCIAQDIRSGQTGTWYYGTGEWRGNSASGSGAPYRGDGIYKSTDNGATWSLLSATSTETPEFWDQDFDYNHEIVVNPINGNVLVANVGGIYQSTDGGTSFTEVLAGGSGSQWSDVVVSSTGLAYAVIDDQGVFSSADGVNWTNITPSSGYSLNAGERKELALAPSNENILYLLGEDGNNGSGHSIWRFDEATDTWEDRSANVPQLGGQTGNFDSQGSYNLLLTVKTDDENFVIIGGTNLFRSTDGFASTSNTTWIGGYTASNDSYALYPDHHPDQHSFVFLSNDVALSGNDGGVQITSDITTTLSSLEAVDWVPLNNGYLTTQVYAISVGPGNQIMAGFQDNGTWLTTTTDGEADWSFPFGGDGAYSAFNSDGTVRFVSSQFGNIYRVNYSSADDTGADNFTFFTPSGYSAGLFIVPFYLDPTDDDLFYLAGSSTLYVNTQARTGSSTVGWKTISLNALGIVSEIGVSGGDVVYAGTSAGELFKVQNPGGSETVTNITGSNFPPGYISGIGVNQLNPNEIVVCFSNYSIVSVFHSSNGGQDWTDISGNLEENSDGSGSGPSVRHAQILGNSDRYFVGTSTGLYSTASLAAGSTVWTQEDGTGIGDVVVDHLFARNDGLIVAGTHGNGVFSAAFEVSGLPAIDLGVTDLLQPGTGSLSNAEEVVAEVSNLGTDDQSDFTMTLTVDGNLVATDAVSATIMAGEKYEHTFSSTYDFSAQGDYVVTVSVEKTGDENSSNNTLTRNISSVEVLSSYPYFESFETADHGWNVLQGAWELGTPSQTDLNGAFDGSQAWATDLDADYISNELAILESPAFDFSDLTDIEMSMALNYSIEGGWDGAHLGYRTDNQSGYEPVPLEEGIMNWYNHSSIFALGNLPGWSGSTGGTYLVSSASLNFLAGESFVQLALIFASDGTVVDQGIAMDAFTISGFGFDTDLSVMDIPEPNGGVMGSEVVTAIVQNEGATAVSEFNLSYSVNGVENDAIAVTLDPGINTGEYVEITFPNLYDFSQSGTYTVSATVDLTADENPSNDTFSKEVFNIGFQGFYLMEQVAPTTSGPAAVFGGGGTLFSASGQSTIFIDVVDQNTRKFAIEYLSHLNFDNLLEYTFVLDNGSVIFGDNQETDLLCGSEIFLGTADTPGTYDPANDETFTLTLKEDITDGCGVGSPDVTFTLTKISDSNLNQSDLDALMAIYESAGGEHWNNEWDLEESPLTWSGVTFSSEGRVIELNLGNNNLVGEIAPEIGNLTELVGLAMGTNGGLTGEIPSTIGGLVNLERLDIDFCSLTGSIPSEIGDLLNLTVLDIDGNLLSGEIPTSIGNLTGLTSLDLDINLLTGQIPSSLGNLVNLNILDLDFNQLSGSVPTELGNLSNLSSVDLSDNLLEGIPNEFSALSVLDVLDLGQNNVVDLPDLSALPLSFFSVQNNLLDFGDVLPNISVLTSYAPQADLGTEVISTSDGSNVTLNVVTSDDGTNTYQWYKDDVLLSGETNATLSFTFGAADAGEYRCEISNPGAPSLILNQVFLVLDQSVTSHPDYAALEALYFSTLGEHWFNNSNWLTNPDLSAWTGITLDGNQRVSEINLSGNNLNGPLPDEFGDLTSLIIVQLANNSLHDQIPGSVGNLTNVIELYLGNNNLSGSIPSTIGGMSSLAIFGAPNNNLSGEIPSELGDITGLVRIGLRNNNLSGDVPASLSSLGNLTHLNMHDNEIASLPDLSGLSLLNTFQVQNNALNFGDIVPNVSRLSNYSPQQDIDDSFDDEVLQGDMYTMDVSDLTSGNTYQWFFDDVPISGATGSSYTIASFSMDNDGTYTCEINNSSAPSLTLTRNPISLFFIEVELVLELSSAEIAENQSIGTVIGSLSISGTENDDQFDYSLSGPDASSFSLGGSSGTDLLSAAEFDFEDQSIYEISVSAFEGATTVITDFTISVTDEAEAPTEIILSETSVEENIAEGSLIATISVVDDDLGDTHTLAISGTDASSFEIDGDQLLSAKPFDFESQPSLSVTIVAVDNTSRTVSQDFTISVIDITPEAPKDIILSNDMIEEGQAAGTAVGVLTVEDDDVGETHTFALLGADASSFQLADNELQSSVEFDFSEKEIYEITVLATDDGGLSLAKDFTITVTSALGVNDLDDGLVAIYPNPTTGNFNIVIDPSLRDVSWRMTDVSGKVIVGNTRIDNSSEVAVKVTSIESGIYFVRVDSREGSTIKRILITR